MSGVIYKFKEIAAEVTVRPLLKENAMHTVETYSSDESKFGDGELVVRGGETLQKME